MLTANEMSQLRSMDNATLAATVRVMNYQVSAPLLIGNRERSTAVRNAANLILSERVAAK